MKNFFTISEVGKVCDISRSTIMCLEERGLLTPGGSSFSFLRKLEHRLSLIKHTVDEHKYLLA